MIKPKIKIFRLLYIHVCFNILFVSLGIPLPPSPIVTRWGSWLEASLYYAEHLPIYREIVAAFSGSGILSQNAKNACEDRNLVQELVKIKHCYSGLIELLISMQDSLYSIRQAKSDFIMINFHDDQEIPGKATEKESN